jgi:hypothetical protein
MPRPPVVRHKVFSFCSIVKGVLNVCVSPFSEEARLVASVVDRTQNLITAGRIASHPKINSVDCFSLSALSVMDGVPAFVSHELLSRARYRRETDSAR